MNQALQIDPGTRDVLHKMIALVRQGARDEARRIGKAALAEVGDVAPVHAILGRLACESGDFADGLAELREAIALLPDDTAVRSDLAAALIQTGDLPGAMEVCDSSHMLADPSLQIGRFRGYAAQQLERWPDAIEAYRHVVARAPDDAGTWNNLGNALSAAGDLDGALEALRRAAALDPNAAPTRLNIANSLFAADRADEAIDVLRVMAADFPADAKPWVELAQIAEWMDQSPMALEAYEEAAKRAPHDPEILIALGNQRGASWDMAGAEQAIRRALAVDPANGDALVALAVLFEHDNRADLLPALVDEAIAANIDPATLALIQAYASRRAKNWQGALDAARNASEEKQAVRRAQLIGECLDRLGQPAEAFASFERMNQLVAEERNPQAMAQTYRDMVERNRSTLTKAWIDSWTPAVPPQSSERASPVFLVGFPRSGTTLLDTILMGHPAVQVMEERPAIVHVERRLGDIEALAAMDAKAIKAARTQYWSEAADYLDLRPGTTVIDKSPLYLNKVPIIHRLFPDARIILALRHPMDAVLSCFVTNFRPNPAMANFLDLARAAELYDRSMGAFEQARQLIGLDVHEIAYERVIADRDSELRPLFDWLGLEWQEEALDHQATAAKRGIISTASYAQVHEPLYTRSTGRWARYRDQLKPVEGLLAPWIERFGYSLDDPAKLPPRERA